MPDPESVNLGECKRTQFHCPRCGLEFRREYAPVGALNDARAELARYRTVLQRVDRAALGDPSEDWGAVLDAVDGVLAS